MARIRSVKPELRTSEVVASWPIEVRYFFVLLWGYLDDRGRGLDVPKTIAGDCFPHDQKITASKVDKWLDSIAAAGPVCRYEVAGRRYLHTVNSAEHQKPNRPTPSRIPPCPVHEPLTESNTESGSESASEAGSESPDGDSVPGIRSSVGSSRGGSSRGAGEQGSTPRESPSGNAPPIAGARLVTRVIGPEFPAATRTALAWKASELLKQYDDDTVTEALTAWRSKPDIGPGLLPSLVADVVKRRNGHTRRAADKPSTTDTRMAAIQALKHPEPDQPALPAGANP